MVEVLSLTVGEPRALVTEDDVSEASEAAAFAFGVYILGRAATRAYRRRAGRESEEATISGEATEVKP